jgi:hypothetical protein
VCHQVINDLVNANSLGWQRHIKLRAPLGLRLQTVLMLKLQELIQSGTNSGNKFFDVRSFSVVNLHSTPWIVFVQGSGQLD